MSVATKYYSPVHSSNLNCMACVLSMLMFDTLLVSGFVAILTVSMGSAMLVIIETQAHSPPFNPCSPLTIIKECGIPKPVLRTFEETIMPMIGIVAALVLAIFAFRMHLRRKDFYEVRYRGG